MTGIVKAMTARTECELTTLSTHRGSGPGRSQASKEPELIVWHASEVAAPSSPMPVEPMPIEPVPDHVAPLPGPVIGWWRRPAGQIPCAPSSVDEPRGRGSERRPWMCGMLHCRTPPVRRSLPTQDVAMPLSIVPGVGS
jgi:hypothetical protein